MPAPPPLGRSLLPIPGESLPGFLLRLSCRLHLAPARLAELTGLTPAGHSGTRLPAILLAGIPASASQEFTRMTRLTADKITKLGLATWQGRYPLHTGTPKNAAALPQLDIWSVFAPATRYCPDCLTGDRSAIQEAFGGPWHKAWHLPVVFACPLHQRLLEHRCPECDQVVRARRPGTYSALLPAMHVGGLHPAQCRAELIPSRGRSLPACCGARLDQTARRRPASPELFALQDKILDLLTPDGPASTLSAGRPTQPISYFTDLQALGLLACSTWPAARHLSPSEEAVSAIDQHVTSLRRQAADRQENSPASASRARHGPPPMDAAASSGLAHIADRVLAGSPDEVREQLRLLLPASTRKASRTSWALRVIRSAAPCSEGLQAAYAPLLRAFTKAGGQPQGRRKRRPPFSVLGPGEHPGIPPRRLVRTPLQAAHRRQPHVHPAHRGAPAGPDGRRRLPRRGRRIPGNRIRGHHLAGQGPNLLGGRLRPQRGQAATRSLGFETALNVLARELNDTATPLINYQQRRQALETWCIDKDAWTGLVARLPPVPGPQRPELGDRKRQIASIYVWVQLTFGEHYFAPRPIEATQPPEVQEAWKLRRNTIWHVMHRSQPGPHYTSLKAELNTLATSLVRTIDTHRS